MIVHALRLLLAGGVLFVAVLAFVASTATEPSHGVSGEEAGLVSVVEPGGPVWRDGIRVGDRVVELRAGGDPGGWLLVVNRGTTEYSSAGNDHIAKLRQYEAWSVVAVFLAILAALP